MEQEINTQKRFFIELKSKIPSNISMASLVADELKISIDSAYRRIRGESDLSLVEFDKLSSKYAISTDDVLSKPRHSLAFTYKTIKHDQDGFNAYFKSLTEDIKSLHQYGLKEIIYGALDLPLFYYFIFPNLAAFKIFFWMRNVFDFPNTEESQFSFDRITSEDLKKSYKLWKSYLQVPTVEIWNEETINTTIRQINYYNEIGMFERKEDVFDILEDLRNVVSHIEKQAELGYKFCPHCENDQKTRKDNFIMYYNEVTFSENVVLLKLDNFNMVHLGHNVLNILTTSDESFFKDAYGFIQRVMKNSALISVTSEKQRKRFFNILYHKIDAMMANL